jgi:hypothetical protein
VLGSDAPAGGHVVGERDVTCSVDVQRRSVHVLVDDDAAVVGVEAGIGGEMRVGTYGDDDVAVERDAAVEVGSRPR